MSETVHGNQVARNLVQDLEVRASESPNRVALIFEDGRTWTFAQLNVASSLVARELSKAASRGSRIGIHVINGPDLVLGLTGCWKAGLVPVPMSGMYTPAEVAACTAKTSPTVLIAESAKISAASISMPLLSPDILRNAGELARKGEKYTQLAPIPATDDEALILFTGGSTGAPKAVAITHTGTYASMSILAGGQKGGPRPASGLYPPVAEAVSPNLVLLPLFHGGGIQSLLFAWHVGRSVLLVERFSVDRIARLVPQYKVDNLFVLPTMVYDLTTATDKPDLTSVRKVLVAGQRLDAGLKARFEQRFGVVVMSNYGSAELGHVAGWNARDVRDGRWKPGSVGRVYDGVVLEIRGDNDVVQGVGNPGEIWIKSNRTKGYVDSGGDAAALVQDGWVRSGDVGYVDEDRVLFLVGRTRELIKTGGFQVWPAELEAVMRAHPGVSDVAVVGVPDERLGEVPRAFIVRSSEPASEQELVAWCRDKVAHFKAIRGVTFIDQLPRSEAGKVQRAKLVPNMSITEADED
jgi:long-chain acyl-CoA synthetase